MLLSALTVLAGFLAANAAVLEDRATGGFVQSTSGQASFTMYSGCGSPGM